VGRDRRHHGRQRRRRGGRLLGWLPVALVLVVLAAAVASWQLDVGERLGWAPPDPRTDPAAVAPPLGLTLPEWSAPEPVAAAVPATGDGVLPARVRAAIGKGLRDRDLGRHVVAAVGALSGDGPVVTAGRGRAVPASTTKLLTGTAALAALGPEHTFRTTVVAGRTPREVVLVGGGDPFLASRPVPAAEQASTYPRRADVVTLAREAAVALADAGRRRVAVRYDDSLFTGPTDNPRWRRDYVPDGVVSPITALMVDAGRLPDGYGRAADPSRAAAEAFARALDREGVRVVGTVRPATARPGAEQLAAVESAPLADVVEHVLDVSHNEGAEVLAHHVGLEVTGQGSFRGGATGVLRTLAGLGVRTGDDEVYDGSGLSRHNRVSATTLLQVVQLAADPERDDLRAVLTGLPVAGFTGSLAYRFDEGEPAGLGQVRAKTGTLTGVHGLAGVVTDRTGAPMAFVLLADRVRLADNLDAREQLDVVAAELAACRCAAGPARGSGG
jgi:serine-type D-Ala-D-Ala carboxypeptidase/endopeptidase (penicillin-binding protein 4)